MSNGSPSAKKLRTSTGDFFAPGSLSTLAGSSAAVVVITEALNRALGLNDSWIPLLLALAVSVAAYGMATQDPDAGVLKMPRFTRYVLIVLNGCMIYASAFGVQGAVLSSEVVERVSGGGAPAQEVHRTLSSWKPIVPTKSPDVIRRQHSP